MATLTSTSLSQTATFQIPLSIYVVASSTPSATDPFPIFPSEGESLFKRELSLTILSVLTIFFLL
jgi:hypothetical protein